MKKGTKEVQSCKLEDLSEKLEGLETQGEMIKNFDALSQIRKNISELRHLKFEVSKVIASGEPHMLIERNRSYKIDLVEGAYQYFNVDVNGLLSPLRLKFEYKD